MRRMAPDPMPVEGQRAGQQAQALDARLLLGLPQRRRRERGVAALACGRPSAATSRPSGCSVSSTRSPSWESAPRRGGQVAGHALTPHRVLVGVQWSRNSFRRRPPRRSARSSPPARPSSACRLTRRGPCRDHSAVVVLALCRSHRACRPCGSVRRPGTTGRIGLAPTNAPGSSRSSAVGIRSGCAPDRVTSVWPRVRLERLPQCGRLAQTAGPELEADQRGEGPLGGAAGGAAPVRSRPARPRTAAGPWPRRSRRCPPSPRPGRAWSPAGPARPSAAASPPA